MKLRSSNCLFLDAGYAKCGAVVINTRTWEVVFARVIQTEPRPKEPTSPGMCRRVREVAFQLDKITSDYNVRLVAGELPHGGAQSAGAMRAMTAAICIIASFCGLRDLEFLAVTPTEIKRLVRDKGAVSKDEVEKVVIKAFGNFLPKKKALREHLSDAAGAALVARQKFSTKFFNDE